MYPSASRFTLRGGKGNVKQLGKQLYVWHFDEGKGNQTEEATAGLVGEFNGNVKWAEGILGKAVEMAGFGRQS